jgi:hypothetical protein
MAYGTVTDWRTYASARGNAAPSAADQHEATSALERASDYIRTRFVLPQGRMVDEAVTEATYIAASLELATPGLFGGAVKPGDAKILTRVGTVEWEPLPGATAGDMVPRVAAIEALLAPVASSIGIGLMVV